MKFFYTYIAHDDYNNSLKVSVTINLKRRFKLLNQLKNNSKITLVYFEEYSDSLIAIKREIYLKKLQSKLLENLVLDNNPMLINLIDEIE